MALQIGYLPAILPYTILSIQTPSLEIKAFPGCQPEQPTYDTSGDHKQCLTSIIRCDRDLLPHDGLI
jgi:hypothetical protein